MTKPKPLPSLASIFGKKNDVVSKSWSDLWDEEAEESEHEDLAMKQRREQNSRSFSHESQDDDVTVRLGERPRRPIILGEKSRSASNIPRLSDFKPDVPIKQSNGSDENGFFEYMDSRPSKHLSGKRTPADRWAALGNKRRSYQPAKDSLPAAPKKRSMTMSRRKDWGLGSSGYASGVPHKRGNHGPQHTRPVWLDQDWRRDHHPLSQHKPIYDSADDDLEWVGGWHAFHL